MIRNIRAYVFINIINKKLTNPCKLFAINIDKQTNRDISRYSTICVEE